MTENQSCLPNGRVCDIFQTMAERSGEQFGRLITAMVTPFDPNDVRSLHIINASRLAIHLAENQTTSIVVTGTTGESPTLKLDERKALLCAVLETVGDRVKVIAGTSTYDTDESMHLSQEAQKEGAHGLLLVTPYYNKPSQRGLDGHFGSIVEATHGEIPIILYNVPSRTNVNINPDIVWELAEKYPSIVGLKEARGLDTEKDREHVDRILKEKPKGFTVWSGNDQDTYYFLTHGGFGVVSVASHVVGRKIDEMIRLVTENASDTALAKLSRPDTRALRLHKASQINSALQPLFKALFPPASPEPSPVAIKEMLSQLGLYVGGVRLPLVEEPQLYKDRLFRLLETHAKYLDSMNYMTAFFPTPYFFGV